MREILFKGKKIDTGEWLEGIPIKTHIGLFICFDENPHYCHLYGYMEIDKIAKVDETTLCQYTELTDKNGKQIWEGDIVQYLTYNGFDCHSVVKLGKYKQDGSGGEYDGRECVGFYVEVDNFTCPDWYENQPEYFPYHIRQQNILEVASGCEVIGNIFDNPELLKGVKE